jgi:two-component system NtrC family response regulator
MKIDRNKLIFVVDDDKAFNALISQYLLTIGFKKVKSFFSGEDAVKAIDLKPDIVMQDYDLPGINGVNVLEEFKKKNPQSEFIFLSGQSSIDVAVDAIQKGAFDYIVKDNFARENAKNKITKVLTINSLQKNRSAFKIASFTFIGLFILSWILFFIFFYR